MAPATTDTHSLADGLTLASTRDGGPSTCAARAGASGRWPSTGRSMLSRYGALDRR